MSGLQEPQASEISQKSSVRPPARLKLRAHFLACGKGKRLHTGAFSLQCAQRQPADSDGPRFGLTVTKKEGNSPTRNRIRRRLREVLRVTSALCALSGTDYVLVARRDSLKIPFAALQHETRRAIVRVANARPASRAKRRDGAPPSPSRPEIS